MIHTGIWRTVWLAMSYFCSELCALTSTSLHHTKWVVQWTLHSGGHYWQSMVHQQDVYYGWLPPLSSYFPQYLLHYLLAMSRWVDQEAWTKSHLPSISLCLLQDSYHTPLPLSLSPHKLATAVLYLAVLSCRLNIPGMYSYSAHFDETRCVV